MTGHGGAGTQSALSLAFRDWMGQLAIGEVGWWLHCRPHTLRWLCVMCWLLLLLLPVTRAGLVLHLDSVNIKQPSALYQQPGVVGNVLVAPTAKIGADCKLGPDVSIGEGCVIGDGVRLSNCVIMRGVSIGHHTKVRGQGTTGRDGLGQAAQAAVGLSGRGRARSWVCCGREVEAGGCARARCACRLPGMHPWTRV